MRWQHENRREGWTTDAMDLAAISGNLHIVKWLHENRPEGCTENAMDYERPCGCVAVATRALLRQMRRGIDRTHCLGWSFGCGSQNIILHAICEGKAWNGVCDTVFQKRQSFPMMSSGCKGTHVVKTLFLL